eukprot:TRINITY_DN2289_c0_g1_i7.p1 TRINITY_DN2289_c0_g1~~TRINITY_DN2289_c0_g1_i7.p1  ORF type:complete len:164 (+),score=18.59 TRINITY_DN2289_c0_g1_i7:3-494(+)
MKSCLPLIFKTSVSILLFVFFVNYEILLTSCLQDKCFFTYVLCGNLKEIVKRKRCGANRNTRLGDAVLYTFHNPDFGSPQLRGWRSSTTESSCSNERYASSRADFVTDESDAVPNSEPDVSSVITPVRGLFSRLSFEIAFVSRMLEERLSVNPLIGCDVRIEG